MKTVAELITELQAYPQDAHATGSFHPAGVTILRGDDIREPLGEIALYYEDQNTDRPTYAEAVEEFYIGFREVIAEQFREHCAITVNELREESPEATQFALSWKMKGNRYGFAINKTHLAGNPRENGRLAVPAMWRR